MTDEIAQLLRRYTLISDQVDAKEIQLVLRSLAQTATVAGDVVEFGCYAGTTSLFITRLLRQMNSEKQFYVYDSFAGLPEKDIQDQSPAGTQFVAGELSVSKRQFIENFKKAGLPLPYIYKGWFEDVTVHELPEQIAFAFLDGDYYSSIKTSLALITPRLAPGAYIVVDDYANIALPGAARAVDEWRTRNNASLHVEHSLAIMKLDS